MAGQSELAKAYLAIHLDKKALSAELSQLKTGLGAALKGMFTSIPVKIDTKGLSKASGAIRAAINAMAKKSPIVIPVRIDMRAQGKIVRSIRSIARGMARRLAVTIPVKVDSPRASIAIRRLRRDIIKYVAKNPITIPVRLVPIGMQGMLNGMHKNVSRGMTQVKSSMLGTFRSIATIAGGILAAIGIYRLVDAVKALGGAMLGGNASMEQYQISFEVLLKSATRAEQMISDIRKMASDTPFELPGLVGAAQQMLAFGFEADKVLPMLRSIGDAASANPEGMEYAIQRITRALGQMRAKGKISAEEMMQLTEAQIPAWELLATEMGKTTAEVMDMSRRGQLESGAAIEKLLAGIDKKYGGLMSRQAKSFTGMMSTLRDDTANALIEIGKPIFDLAKVKLSNLLGWMKSDAGAAFVAKLKGGMESVIETAKQIGSVIKAVWESPVTKVVLKIGALIAGAFLFVKAIGLAAGVIGGIGAAIGPVVGAAIAAIFSPIGLAVAAVAALAASFKMALDSSHGVAIKGTLGEIWTLITEIGTNLAEIGASLRDALAPTITWIGELFKNMWNTAKESSGSFWEAVLGWVKETADILSLLTTNWRTTWEIMKASAQLQLIRLVDVVANVCNTIKSTFAAVGTFIAEVFKGVWKKIQGEEIDILGEAYKKSAASFARNRNPGLAESPEQKMLRDEIQRLADSMVQEREVKREVREAARDKTVNLAQPPLTGKKAEQATTPGAVAAGKKKEMGKIEFADLASYSQSLQTKIGDTYQQKMAKTAEESLKVEKKTEEHTSKMAQLLAGKGTVEEAYPFLDPGGV